jgi:peptidoglycan/LPS O-acetylase OafA/YrhL
LTVVIAPIARVLAFSLGVGYVGIHVLSLTRADALAFGVLAAAAVRHQPAIEFLKQKKWKFRLLALLPCSLLVIATWKDWQLGTLYMALYGYSALALCYFLLILDLIVFPDSTLAVLFRNGKLRWLGTISYAAYLFHQVVNLLCDRVIRAGHSGPLWTLTSALIATAITLGLAQLSWTHFESKLVSYARRFSYDGLLREKKKLVPALVEI